LSLRKYFDIKIPLFAILIFIAGKFGLALYITTHNLLTHNQWSYTKLSNSGLTYETFTVFKFLFLSPVIETLIFCTLIRLLFKDRKVFLLLSSVLFASIHYKSDGILMWGILTFTLFAGFILAYLYEYFRKFHGEFIATLQIITMHSIANLLVLYV